MTCKDCLHYEACNYWLNKDAKHLNAFDGFVCEHFKNRSEWVHLPNEEYTFTIRGDLAKGIIIANCRAAELERERD